MNEWGELRPDEVFKIAIILEKEGTAFYTRAVEGSTDVTGRAMFEYLVAEEERHLELFRSELGKLIGTEADVDPEPDEEERLRGVGKVLDVFAADRGIHPGMDETDVVRVAAAIEKEVYLFYRRASESEVPSDTGAVLKKLAEEEWGHYQMLSTILDGLTEESRWIPHETVSVAAPPSYGEWSLDEWKSSWNIEVGSLYTCSSCSSMIMVTKGGVGTLAPECCGLPMTKISPGAGGGGR